MSKLKLYLDEDVWTGLSIALQKAGFDVVTVSGLQRKAIPEIKSSSTNGNGLKPIPKTSA